MRDLSIPFLSESEDGIEQDLGQKIRTKRQGLLSGQRHAPLLSWVVGQICTRYRIGHCPRAVARLGGAMVSPSTLLSKHPSPPPRRGEACW